MISIENLSISTNILNKTKSEIIFDVSLHILTSCIKSDINVNMDECVRIANCFYNALYSNGIIKEVNKDERNNTATHQQ